MTTSQGPGALHSGLISLEELRGSLEAGLDLQDLERVANLLGFGPAEVAHGSSRSALAAKLVERCARRGAVDALCDMAVYVRPSLGERLRSVQSPNGAAEPLRAGDAIGDTVVERRVGESELASVLCVRQGSARKRLKLVLPDAPVRRGDVERWFAATRAAAALDHPTLPSGVVASAIDVGGVSRLGVMSDWLDGDPLSLRWADGEAFRLREVWPVLRPILEGLAALHAAGLVHGAVSTNNVLVENPSAGQRVLLVDGGFHHVERPLSALIRETNSELSPEQIEGAFPTPRSDVYAFGALLYRALAGRPAFGGSGFRSLLEKVTRDAEPLSFVAPRGTVIDELDELLLEMLDRDPARRPAHAAAVLDVLESLLRLAERHDDVAPDSQFDAKLTGLLDNPSDDVAAAVLESAVDRGVSAGRVAEGFHLAAEQALEAGDRATAKRLLVRAATLFEGVAGGAHDAEETYELLLNLDPGDESTKAALIRLYRSHRRFDRLAELLLDRAEKSLGGERARAFAELGTLFADHLGEREQAVVAYAHAVAAKPEERTHIERLEALAGDRDEAWQEVFSVCSDAISEDLPADHRHTLLCQLGRWYVDRAHRPDLALKCYQAVLLVDPAHDPALAAAAEIFRKARQYRELSQVLLLRAGGAVSPTFARELRVEAADVLERHLGEAAAARDLYRQVVDEDAGNDEAAARLLAAYERGGDTRAQAQLLERQAASLEGQRRHAALCRLGDLELIDLDDARSALRRYESVIADDPASMDALRGAERAYRVTEQYDRLVENLEQQLRLSVTARQKLDLLRQIAAVHAEQFLDHERATTTLERMLDVDRAHEPALVELARHYRALGRFDDVARVLERHVELIEDRERRAATLLELASVLERQVGATERALAAYEAVRELDPREPTALDALARLRATSGDDRALDAIEALAHNAPDAASRATHLVRAARWLESRGQLEHAIVRYKRALGEVDDPDAFSGLRAAYLKRGDRRSALELVERQLERVSSAFEQAELWGVAAGLRRDLEDLPGAERAAREALERDPTERGARTLLGDLAFDAGRFAEAARHFEAVVSAADATEQADAPRIHARYAEALARQGERERALQIAEGLARFAPDRIEGHRLVAQLSFELGSYERAREENERVIERFGTSLGERERAAILYRLGESLRALGRLDEAGPRLERAADLDPEAVDPLRALCEVYEGEERWWELRSVLERLVERESAERKSAALIALGDVCATRFGDATEAAKLYLAALAERPRDRKILLKLIGLYSESRDWEQLIAVISELCEAADDPIQKARYLHTAARVAAEELNDVPRSLALLEQALREDPKLVPAVRDSIELNRRAGDLDALERVLEHAVSLASDAGDRDETLRLLEELATLAASRDRIDQAVAAYEAAQRLEPANTKYGEKLAELYVLDPRRYLERASDAQEAMLRNDPYRAEPFRALRELYMAAQLPDAVWCTCQTLTVLGRAQPEEEAFFKKNRRDVLLESSGKMSDRDWAELLTHPGADPLVTEIFALVEPCMLAVRGRSLRAYGLSPSGALKTSDHPHGLVRWLGESSRLLGIELPLLIHEPKRAGALQLLPSRPRAIVLASAALNARLPDRRAAFVAAAHLVYVRPGLGARYLVPTVIGLKAWLLAALRILTPRLPIGAELEGPVAEAQAAIAEHSTPALRDRMARPIRDLLDQGAQVDIGRWVRAVDLTSDRAGLVVCDDLQTAVDAVRDAGDGANSVLAADRGKQLMRWAVSRRYIELRERLGLSLPLIHSQRPPAP